MSGVSVFGFTLLKSNGKIGIEKLFEQYETKLSNQKQDMSDYVREWGQTLVQKIQQYVFKQVYLIEREHAEKLTQLHKIHNQFDVELSIHEQSKNTEQINELLKKCEEVKIELRALETNEQTIPFLEMPSSQTNRSNGNDANTGKLDDGSLDDIEETDEDTKSGEKTNKFWNFFRRRSSQDNRAELSQFENGSEDDQHGDISDKCSVCLMIFPKRMSQEKRIQHINEHDLRE